MASNYYFILGVAPGATLDEIKSAYRRRAREYHPDQFGADIQPFLDVQEAYAVLSSPAHRTAYDRRLRDVRKHVVTGSAPESLGFRKSAAEPLKPPHPQADLGEASLLQSFRTIHPSFDEIFDRLWRNIAGIARPKAEMPEDLRIEFLLTPDEARRGGHVRLMMPARADCPTCNGSGALGLYECWRCAGEGSISGGFPVTVAFPAGISDGYELAIPLDHLGIRNLFLTVCFRISRAAEESN
ncbi:MAG: DnaJ domain-containing protein [Acidobacteriota bacterium]